VSVRRCSDAHCSFRLLLPLTLLRLPAGTMAAHEKMSIKVRSTVRQRSSFKTRVMMLDLRWPRRS
jgi:hypothetical protein